MRCNAPLTRAAIGMAVFLTYIKSIYDQDAQMPNSESGFRCLGVRNDQKMILRNFLMMYSEFRGKTYTTQHLRWATILDGRLIVFGQLPMNSEDGTLNTLTMLPHEY